MTILASMFIYGKTLKIFYPGTSGLISTKHGIYHRGLNPIIILYVNDYPGLTLTYFTTRSAYASPKDSLEIIAVCDLEGC